MNCAKWLGSACCVLAIAMLAACSTRVTYDGQRLSPTEEAVLSGGTSKDTGGTVSIIKVDGQLYINGSFRKGVGASRLLLKPGRHSVTIVHSRYSYEARADLWLEAAPGGQYLAQAGRQNGNLMIWIEDAVTGQRVGGIDENPVPLISNFKKD